MYLDISMKIRLNVAANNKTKQIVTTPSMFCESSGQCGVGSKKNKKNESFHNDRHGAISTKYSQDGPSRGNSSGCALVSWLTTVWDAAGWIIYVKQRDLVAAERRRVICKPPACPVSRAAGVICGKHIKHAQALKCSGLNELSVEMRREIKKKAKTKKTTTPKHSVYDAFSNRKKIKDRHSRLLNSDLLSLQ